MTNQEKILIVEDDAEIARVMMDHLRQECYLPTWASTGSEGWDEFKNSRFDLILVDLMLPEMDGFQLSEKIRLESDVPLLIVSARQEQEHKIQGLDLGADDYLTKPFSLGELSARISSHLRRYRRYRNKTGHADKQFFSGGLEIDFTNNVIRLDKVVVPLSAKERELLFLLAKNTFKTFSKSELYHHIWEQQELQGNNTVTVHIKSLRTKLKDETRSAKYIETVWGVGYRFIGESIE
ncbi:response regulator transcription factor [Sediminibacillus halophilus]|uniref:DNA-binding response regulator, OmpR family, contains REC and winged-helix (WHTH) domain n=1 Tax=Sediminibacillus halophilus TaxID=482461 RepID=A0A1G9NK69_9BACI|nr:response regulator transcription factor [Sediminibacillus halophilus]SDL86996.1 DNA-binding response regulator, OmpR family, contains REC and winged-helix (wHTH) domain [Sediminibacillus halophilus]